MKVSIVTPSFRSSDYLKRCVASVADQNDVDKEHIVQDSCSDDGTQDWLPRDDRVRSFIEKDAGMYDAINRGFRRANGEILAHLNCDEQYLPGALKKVADFFRDHADVDVVFADALIIDPQGQFISYRKVVKPTINHIKVGHLPTFTCSTFYRRKVIDDGLIFDESLKDIADAYWVIKLLQSQHKFAVMGEYTTAFTETGQNMNLLPNARREVKELYESAPASVRLLRPAFIAGHRLAKLMAGCYSSGPISYAVYTPDSLNERVRFSVQKPTPFWPRTKVESPA